MSPPAESTRAPCFSRQRTALIERHHASAPLAEREFVDRSRGSSDTVESPARTCPIAVLLRHVEREEGIVREKPHRFAILRFALALAFVLEVPCAEHEVRAIGARRVDDCLTKEPFVFAPDRVRFALRDMPGDDARRNRSRRRAVTASIARIDHDESAASRDAAPTISIAPTLGRKSVRSARTMPAGNRNCSTAAARCSRTRCRS